MSGEEVVIRPAEPGDVEGFVAAYEWLFEPPGSRPPDWDPAIAGERVQSAIDSADALPLLADGGGEIVGLCTAYIDLLSVRFGTRCWVEDLAVDPRRRSEGIGARLLAGARDWAAERGASHLELDSADARTDAHRFYEREGAAYRSVSFGWPGLDRS